MRNDGGVSHDGRDRKARRGDGNGGSGAAPDHSVDSVPLGGGGVVGGADTARLHGCPLVRVTLPDSFRIRPRTEVSSLLIVQPAAKIQSLEPRADKFPRRAHLGTWILQ